MLYLCEGIVATSAEAFHAREVSNSQKDSSDEDASEGNAEWNQSMDPIVLQDSSNAHTLSDSHAITGIVESTRYSG